tara:strand:- start:459 stop:677 length:219 start_codon:yes stop_codon:yes gene_type:complete
MKTIDEIAAKYLGKRLTDSCGLEFIRFKFSNPMSACYASREIRRKHRRHITVSGNVMFVWNEHHTLDMEEID